MSDSLRVFISYAHEDDEHRARLEQTLRPLEREFSLECWTDRAIIPGGVWSEEIGARLHDADLILFLVSDDFLASDFIHHVELRTAFQEVRRDSAHVIPIIVRACDWDSAPFAAFVLGEERLLGTEGDVRGLRSDPGTWLRANLTEGQTPRPGDLVLYDSGYAMFYFEKPGVGPFVIGMTPFGVTALKPDFTKQYGVRKVRG